MGLGNELCRAAQHLTQSIGRLMEFNADLWNERFSSINKRMDTSETKLQGIHIALFGNGEKDKCISEEVKRNSLFREEMEKMLHAIRNDLVKKMAWALVIVTVVLLGGFGGILYSIMNVTTKITNLD